MIKINALRCLTCGDTIYSRAHYDFHRCSCGDIFVDGGFDYLRAGWGKNPPVSLQIEVDATKKMLYDDWNNKTDKFGRILKYTSNE